MSGNSPTSEKKGFFSRLKSSIGAAGVTAAIATLDAKDAASVAISDAKVETPRMEKVGAEKRYDIEDDIVQDTKSCYVYVTCAVGKEIRDKIKNQLEEAAREFNASLEKIAEPTGSINNIKNFSTQVSSKTTSVNNAKTAYEKKCNAVIKLETALACKLSVKNTRDVNGVEVKKTNGTIVEINPKERTLKLKGSGYIKTSKGIVEHKVKMSTITLTDTFDVKISELCVGGETADDNNQGQCFAQVGGSKKSHKAEILEVSSDMGICE